MDFKKIFQNNEKWIQDKLNLDPDYFAKLSQGQSPQILYIGCSDSRVTTEELMGAQPGEIFIHRNIANMVISIDLKVKHIVVCGHYECGGIKAAMTPTDMGILNPWLRNIRDVYRHHQDEMDQITDPQLKINRLTELNVLEQCTNLIKTAAVQEAYLEYGLTVHGWVFDIYCGRIIDLKIDYPKILKEIMKIYDLTQ